MKDIYVVHHSADFDGLFCREIARKHYGHGAHYLGWDYGDEVPFVPGDAVLVMMDISIDGLMDHPGLIWIDHHKTAIDKYPSSIPGFRMDGVAACRLAWQYFFNPGGWKLLTKDQFHCRRVTEPLAVTLAGEYDVFDHSDKRALTFQSGLKSRNLLAYWPHLLCVGAIGEQSVRDLLANGRIIEYYREQLDASIVLKSGFDVEFEGLKFLALNTPRCNSFSFAAGIEPHHDGLLAFWWHGEKARWTVSMYGVPGKPDIDFSAIAVKYGGGGHKQACGFITDALPFVGGVKPTVRLDILDPVPPVTMAQAEGVVFRNDYNLDTLAALPLDHTM